MMSIPLNLVRLRKDPQHLCGEVPAADLAPDLGDELMQISEPMSYDLTAEWMDGAALIRGHVTLPVDCECSRCLTPFQHLVDLDDYALHLPLTGEEAPPVQDDCVDLTPFLREDSLLGLPQHPLCRSDCPGLSSDGAGPLKSDPAPETGVWSQLDRLKFDKE